MATRSRKTSSACRESLGKWIPVESADANLGDGRMNDRLRSILHAFSAMPRGSIPEACRRCAETKDTYRLLDNGKVPPEMVLAPHQPQDGGTDCRRAGSPGHSGHQSFMGGFRTEDHEEAQAISDRQRIFDRRRPLP